MRSRPKELFSRELLDAAWEHVRRRGESPGVDGIDLETFGADRAGQIDALHADLQSGLYSPQACRAIYLPKPAGGSRRIVVATVRDRVAQTAAMIRLQPLIEPLLHPTCFAYRPHRGVQDALLRLRELRRRGLEYVAQADVFSFFDSADHALLFPMLDAAGIDSPLRELVGRWLTVTILEPNRPPEANALGLPQGLPISPMLANLYLTPFDRRMDEQGWELTRYADDFAVSCLSGEEAQRALASAGDSLALLNLSLAREKSGVSTFEQGFEFLGAHFQGDEVIPPVPHPYEMVFAMPRRERPKHPAVQPLPYKMLRTLYLQNQGSQLGCHSQRFVLTREKATLLDLPANQVDQVFVLGRIQLTSAAMMICLQRDIPVYLFSSHGKYFGALMNSAHNDLELHRAQLDFLGDVPRRLRFARTIADAKIRNSRALLEQHQRNHPECDLGKPVRDLAQALKRLPHARALDVIRGIEGNSAAVYFQGFSACLRGGIRFTQRVRRPPTDPANSMLSFGYSLLFQNVLSLLFARGLDPYVGLFHEPGRNHPALASDLMEELRSPIVDALVLSLANCGTLTGDDFYYAEGAPQPCLMKDEARVRYVKAFEEKMTTLLHHPDAPGEVDWRRAIDLQVCRFRRCVEGKTNNYVPWGRKGLSEALNLATIKSTEAPDD